MESVNSNNIFCGKHQKITNMQIHYAKDANSNLTYQTDFDLIDFQKQESHLTLSEPVNKSTNVTSYYQNLCFSYLSAKKFSRNF